MNLTWTRTHADPELWGKGATRYTTHSGPHALTIIGSGTTNRFFQLQDANTDTRIGEYDSLGKAKRAGADLVEDRNDATYAQAVGTIAPGDEAGPGPQPMTVTQAMAGMLHIARKLDVTTAQSGQQLESLADLAIKLSLTITAQKHADSSAVVAAQHQGIAENGRNRMAAAVAKASAETHEASILALRLARERLAQAIVAYDPRY